MSPSSPGLTRRGIALGALGAGAGVLGGCSAKPAASNVPLHPHTPAAESDLPLLKALLGVERYGIAAYAAAVPLLPPASAAAGKQFLAQELAHAQELEGLIRQAGGEPPKPPAFYDLGHPKRERQLLELLHRVERRQLAAYLEALPRASPSRLRAALAAIVANEAQHVAVIRLRLGLAPIRSALVTGQE